MKFKQKNKKQIVFLEPFPTVMVYKIARLFRKKGYKTILIILLESKGASKEFHKGAFDKIIFFDLSFFKINLKNVHLILMSLVKKLKGLIESIISILKLKPYVIFTRGSPSWPCALTMKLFKKIPIIYFPYDIRCQYYKSVEHAIKFGGMSKFELKAERFCFENADGIIHKGYPRELEFLNGRMLGDKIKLSPLTLSFLPYCSKEFNVPINKNKLSRKDKEIHIVHIDSMGSVGPIGARYVYNTLKDLVNQKIHIHIYSRPNSISKEQLMKFFKEESEFTKSYGSLLKSNYFHLHSPLEPDKIAAEISNYDYGLYPSGPKTELSEYDLELKFSTGNKIASYLEAGLPLIYEDDAIFTGELLTNYKINIPYKIQNLKTLKKRLNKLNYSKLIENVKKARKDFDMNKNFPRLEKFVKNVVKDK
ncbi:hypothetical protein CMI49_00455 [Candidatus Pacearchaeota archaeon]|mgnify:CR=1 FL=1|jgi:hypothetical protein|nr:hypothetical protein [Candidatus Pacearchaeota archaeon]|tara:strand:- start:1012 stop:2274 length:1263 start_codon:yes stop_codon:yes gene_type:complete